MSYTGIPDRYRDARFFDNASTRKAIKAFNQGKSLFLTGVAGSGKTHLSCALLNRWKDTIDRNSFGLSSLENGEICAFTKIVTLNRMIKDSWDKKLIQDIDDFRFNEYGEIPNEGEIISYYSRVPILVMDDLGAGMDTNWVRGTLCTIIDTRYDEGSRTIITSNFNIKQIATELDERIASRLLEIAEVISMENIDHRAEIGKGKQGKLMSVEEIESLWPTPPKPAPKVWDQEAWERKNEEYFENVEKKRAAKKAELEKYLAEIEEEFDGKDEAIIRLFKKKCTSKRLSPSRGMIEAMNTWLREERQKEESSVEDPYADE